MGSRRSESDGAIYVTDVDWERLEALLADAQSHVRRDREHLRELAEALGRACVVACNEIPADVVTMNSQVRLRDEDAGTDMVLNLVYPESANLRRGKVSILAPIGAALLGSRVGDAVEWIVHRRLCRLHIERIMYQPKWSWI